MVGTKLFAITIFAVMLISGIEMTVVDYTDQCIFNCYQCYSKANLVECANECIIMEGIIDGFWSKCKYFDSTPKVSMI